MAQLTKRLIVSNHSYHNLEWLLDLDDYGFTSDNIYIYERSPSNILNVKHLGKVIESPNFGSNIYDIGKHIVENYDDLADINIFVKGNITWRTYTNRKRFLYALTANWFVPIDNDPIGSGGENFYEPWGEKFYVNDSSLITLISEKIGTKNLLDDDDKFSGFYDEIVERPFKTYSRFKNKKEFLEDLFEIGRIPNYMSFCPGANFTVPKQNILKYSKNFYKKMMYYTDYFKNPIESHYYERVYNLIWQGCLEENTSFKVPEDYNG